MKPLKQTRFGAHGNCLQTCVAMLLEMDVEDVPDFCNGPNPNAWQIALSNWLKPRGLFALSFELGKLTQSQAVDWLAYVACPVMFGGDGPRGRKHEVVYCDGRFYDPHPDDGMLASYEDVTLFVTIDPATARGKL